MDYPHLQSYGCTRNQEKREVNRAIIASSRRVDEIEPSDSKEQRLVFRPTQVSRLLPLHVRPIGPPHLRTFISRLPDEFTQCLPTIIQACDRHAATHGGWATKLFSVTHQDIALADVTECARLSHLVTRAVTDTVHGIFGSHVSMDRNQPHILKYDAGHRMTPFHHDQCHLTINLMLSPSDSYKGGGTQIMGVGNVLLEPGEYLIHPGPLLHRGCEITEGTRYLLVFFVYFHHPPIY